MLHLPPPHHISLHVQNVFPILQFSFGYSLPLRQNQIRVRFPLPGIFLFDKVMAQLIHFLFFFPECSTSTSLHNYFSRSFLSGDFAESLQKLRTDQRSANKPVLYCLVLGAPSTHACLDGFATEFLPSTSCCSQITGEL